MQTFVQIEKLSKSFGEVEAVKNLSFEIQKGELFGLIGPDGAGKTTLFRLLATLLLPTQGKMRIGKYDVVKEYRQIRSMLGYMPGKFSLYQDLSVIENLEFFASVFGTRISDHMDLIGDIWEQIKEFRDRPAGKLSGGMKQKLALCCALIHQPELLLLDEPTTGVDAVSRVEFWEMLQSLKEKGITILVSTPYMDEANLCDRVALIQEGEVFQINTPAEIISDFQKELYELKADDLYHLQSVLRSYEYCNSVFMFGKALHYTDKREGDREEEVKKFIKERYSNSVQIKQIKANVEDCFMSFSQSKLQA